MTGHASRPLAPPDSHLMKPQFTALHVIAIVAPAVVTAWSFGRWTSPRLEMPGEASVHPAVALVSAYRPVSLAETDAAERVKAPSQGGTTQAGPESLELEVDPFRRMALLVSAIDGLDSGEWGAWMTAADVWLKTYEREQMLVVWAEQDPRSAAQWMVARQSASAEDGMRVVADHLAGAHPGELLALIRDGVGGTTEFGGIATLALAAPEPELALEALLALPPEAAAPVSHWVMDRLDLAAVESLMPRIDDGEEWQPVRASGYEALARQHALTATPAELRQWAESHVHDPAFAQSALKLVAGHLSESEGLSWINGLPLSKEAKSNALQQVFSEWFYADSQAATAWLGQQTALPSDDADSAASLVVNTVALEDPEAAIAWASSIKDPGMRQGLLESLPKP